MAVVLLGGGVHRGGSGPVARGEHLHVHVHPADSAPSAGARTETAAAAAGTLGREAAAAAVVLEGDLALPGQLHVLEHALQLGREVRPALLPPSNTKASHHQC